MAAAAWIPALLLLQLSGAKMESNADAPGPTGLRDEQFWSEPLSEEPALRFGSLLLREDRRGLFIDLPAEVALDRRTSLPLVAFRAEESAQAHRHPLHRARILVSHLETGSIRSVAAGEAPPPGMDDPAPSPGAVVEDLEADLRLALPSGPILGRYQAVLLHGPDASNRRIVRAFPQEGFAATAEGRKALARLRNEGGAPAPLLVGKSVALRHAAAPAGDAPLWKVALALDADGEARLEIAYRLEVPPRLALPQDKPQVDEAGARIHAVLPVYLLGFDGDRAVCLEKFVGIPVVQPPAGAPDRPVLAGKVSLSVTRLLAGRPPQRSLTLWAAALDQAAMSGIGLAPAKTGP